MVKLEEPEEPACEAAEFSIIEPEEAELASSAQIYICRLCLKDADDVVNIFEESAEQKDAEKAPLEQLLYELFQIKYEKLTALPHVVCRNCLYVVETFIRFRDNVQKCEDELQEHLRNLKAQYALDDDENRPGLNGNAGEFVVDEYFEITEIDPEQEYESSDDDFSMESDTDGDEATAAELTMQNSLNSAEAMQTDDVNTSSAAHKDISAEEQLMMPLQALDAAPTPAILDAAPIKSELLPYGGAAAAAAIAPLIDASMEYTKNTYLCQYCDMAFITQTDCAEHEANHDASAPYICTFCSIHALTRQNLIVHIKELHDAERPYICVLCTKGFCRRSDLKKHTIVHTGVRPFTCTVCNKCFSRNTNLTKHMRIHSSLKPHVCQRCPRSFTTANELMRHARSHSETKPFQCSRCPSSFTRKDKLQLHEQAHNRRESEFLMNQAKSAALGGGLGVAAGGNTTASTAQMESIVVPLNPFAESQYGMAPAPAITAAAPQQPTDDAYRHSILATQLQQRPAQPKPVMSKNSRLFTCNICARQFTRERDLQRHQALHLDTLFTCKQCGTGFSRREKLARHELEAHAPQFPCDICRITFHKLHELEQHKKMHELQQNVAAASINAMNMSGLLNAPQQQQQQPTQQSKLPPEIPLSVRPSASDISFYSQMVPTMNLGFYSETRPEDRNGI